MWLPPGSVLPHRLHQAAAFPDNGSFKEKLPIVVFACPVISRRILPDISWLRAPSATGDVFFQVSVKKNSRTFLAEMEWSLFLLVWSQGFGSKSSSDWVCGWEGAGRTAERELCLETLLVTQMFLRAPSLLIPEEMSLRKLLGLVEHIQAGRRLIASSLARRDRNGDSGLFCTSRCAVSAQHWGLQLTSSYFLD